MSIENNPNTEAIWSPENEFQPPTPTQIMMLDGLCDTRLEGEELQLNYEADMEGNQVAISTERYVTYEFTDSGLEYPETHESDPSDLMEFLDNCKAGVSLEVVVKRAYNGDPINTLTIMLADTGELFAYNYVHEPTIDPLLQGEPAEFEPSEIAQVNLDAGEKLEALATAILDDSQESLTDYEARIVELTKAATYSLSTDGEANITFPKDRGQRLATKLAATATQLTPASVRFGTNFEADDGSDITILRRPFPDGGLEMDARQVVTRARSYVDQADGKPKNHIQRFIFLPDDGIKYQEVVTSASGFGRMQTIADRKADVNDFMMLIAVMQGND